MADHPYEREPDAAAEEAHRAARRQPAEPRDRHPLDHARKVADAIVEALAPACERIEIAGSIRRRAAEVKDIEIVCVPTLARDLFGAADHDRPHDVQLLVDDLVAAGRLAPRLTSVGTARRGRRYQALVAVRAGIALDLFCVLPPAQFGAIMTIRTGPADYSARLVTMCQARGLRCTDGRLVDDRGHDVATPEEADFLRECGAEWLEPWVRR